MTNDKLPNQEEITCLSEIRAGYSCFDEKEEPFYRALSKGIEALRKYLPDSVSKDDVIYRQAAANAIYHHFPKLSMDEARMILHEVPSAQPERKTGKWIEDAETFYRAVNEKGGGVDADTPFFTDDIACPECLAMFSVIDNETERFDFCPACGADMRGEQDETC